MVYAKAKSEKQSFIHETQKKRKKERKNRRKFHFNNKNIKIYSKTLIANEKILFMYQCLYVACLLNFIYFSFFYNPKVKVNQNQHEHLLWFSSSSGWFMDLTGNNDLSRLFSIRSITRSKSMFNALSTLSPVAALVSMYSQLCKVELKKKKINN